MSAVRISNDRGMVLAGVLLVIGITSLLLGSYMNILSTEIAFVARDVGGAQALYAAEAGLGAANDLLAQDWKNATRKEVFPLSEQLTTADEHGVSVVGSYDVAVTVVDPRTLQITSVGRSQPQLDSEGNQQFRHVRTFRMVVVRKDEPSFRRGGTTSEELALETIHFDKDGHPDLLVFSGHIVKEHHGKSVSRVLTSGRREAGEHGFHLIAEWYDVDLDGDLDLLLSDAPSQRTFRTRATIPTMPLSVEEDHGRGEMLWVADVLGTGQPIAVTARGWIWKPADAHAVSSPYVEIFLNHPRYAGTQIVSWGEVLAFP